MRRMTRGLISATAMFVFLGASAPMAHANHEPPFDGPDHDYGDVVDYPLVFPVVGTGRYSPGFWSIRGGAFHHATDILAAKMTPVVAVASGTIVYMNSRCCTVHIRHDDGWTTKYLHLNNDTPGTDDGQGWGIAPGLTVGTKVVAGQLIGWVGDSGNAESTSPHLHFELLDPDKVLVDAYESLRAAQTGVAVALCRPPDSGAIDTLLAMTGLIKRDSRGQAVVELQRFLSALGYDTGTIDGVVGNYTLGAIRSFQEGRGLDPDGIVGPTTRTHIGQVYRIMPAMPVLDDSNRVIRPGYRGDDVANIQKLLAVAGYNPGPADGVYGPNTQDAVADFQRDFGGLVVDGKVGQNTRDALAAFLGLGDFRACG